MILGFITLKDWLQISGGISLGVISWTIKQWNEVVGLFVGLLAAGVLVYKFVGMFLDNKGKRIDIKNKILEGELTRIKLEETGKWNADDLKKAHPKK